jgi:lipoyl-dependent peroxiredoxin
MAVRTANAIWEGALRDGSGTVVLGSGAFQGQYSFRSRFEDGPGTNPEELIGAAHAGCFSRRSRTSWPRRGTSRGGSRRRRASTSSRGGGFGITRIELSTEGEVAGIDEDEFRRHAESAKETCPVSRALAGVEIWLNASLARA